MFVLLSGKGAERRFIVGRGVRRLCGWAGEDIYGRYQDITELRFLIVERFSKRAFKYSFITRGGGAKVGR